MFDTENIRRSYALLLEHQQMQLKRARESFEEHGTKEYYAVLLEHIKSWNMLLKGIENDLGKSGLTELLLVSGLVDLG